LNKDEEYKKFQEAVKAECEKQFKKTASLGKFAEGYKSGFRDGYKAAMEDIRKMMGPIPPEFRKEMEDGAQPIWWPNW